MLSDDYEPSIVIPLMNEEVVFPALEARILECLLDLPEKTEVFFINDGSTDGTRELPKESVARNPNFAAIYFSRSFGHQLAVSAGLERNPGEYVATLDGDLQYPPEMVGKLLEKAREGFDVVYAVRQKRKEGLIKRTAYATFYRLLERLTPIGIPLDSGDFCLLPRRVADSIASMPEQHRFVRGLRAYCGFPQTGITYERAAREAGEPKYSVAKLLQLAADGVFTFSERPLKLATLLGFAAVLVGFGYGIDRLVWRLSCADLIPGLAATTGAVIFLGGVQLICLGILGDDIGRIPNEVTGRPPFMVESFDRHTSQ